MRTPHVSIHFINVTDSYLDGVSYKAKYCALSRSEIKICFGPGNEFIPLCLSKGAPYSSYTANISRFGVFLACLVGKKLITPVIIYPIFLT